MRTWGPLEIIIGGPLLLLLIAFYVGCVVAFSLGIRDSIKKRLSRHRPIDK